MQKKSNFEKRVPELTPRDCGEMLAYNPPLRNQQLAHRLKAYWAAGMKQGQIVKITGYSLGTIKAYNTCFSRALTATPPEAYTAEIFKKKSNKVVFEIVQKNAIY